MTETEAILTCAIFSAFAYTDLSEESAYSLPSEYISAREVIGRETAFVINAVILGNTTVDEAVECYRRWTGIKE